MAHLDSDSFPIVHTPEDTALVRLGDELAQLYPLQRARRLYTIHTAQAWCNRKAEADTQGRSSQGWGSSKSPSLIQEPGPAWFAGEAPMAGSSRKKGKKRPKIGSIKPCCPPSCSPTYKQLSPGWEQGIECMTRKCQNADEVILVGVLLTVCSNSAS